MRNTTGLWRNASGPLIAYRQGGKTYRSVFKKGVLLSPIMKERTGQSKSGGPEAITLEEGPLVLVQQGLGGGKEGQYADLVAKEKKGLGPGTNRPSSLAFRKPQVMVRRSLVTQKRGTLLLK